MSALKVFRFINTGSLVVFDESLQIPDSPVCYIYSVSSNTMREWEGRFNNMVKEANQADYFEAERAYSVWKETKGDEWKKLTTENVDKEHFSPVAGEIRDKLKAEGVGCFYHFTDSSNIDSIEEYGGLYSWATCEKYKIVINCPGGTERSRRLDQERNLENYVRLSFTSNLPMMNELIRNGNLPQPKILKVNIDVAMLKDTQFCDMNANDRYACYGKGIEYLQRVQFDIIKQNYYQLSNKNYFDFSERKYYQAEILVLKHIPYHYLGFTE